MNFNEFFWKVIKGIGLVTGLQNSIYAIYGTEPDEKFSLDLLAKVHHHDSFSQHQFLLFSSKVYRIYWVSCELTYWG